MDNPDQWAVIPDRLERDVWHLWRHVQSSSGGTYGWAPLCKSHIQGPIIPRGGRAEPPKGERRCAACWRRRSGLAAWEEVSQAADWIHAALGVGAAGDPGAGGRVREPREVRPKASG